MGILETSQKKGGRMEPKRAGSVKRELLVFYGLVVLASWVLWLFPVLKARGMDVPDVFLFLSMFASFMPSAIALILMRTKAPRGHFSQALKTQLSFSFNKTYLLAIPAYFLLLSYVGWRLTQWLSPAWTPVEPMPLRIVPILFLQMLFVGGALGEEFGWRGYLFPRIKSLLPLGWATLFLGFFWSLWHLPLFFIPGTVQSALPLWQFLIQNSVMAFYYTWLYERTRGSILLMIYLHAWANVSAALYPAWQIQAGRYMGLVLHLAGLLVLYLATLRRKENRERA